MSEQRIPKGDRKAITTRRREAKRAEMAHAGEVRLTKRMKRQLAAKKS